MSILPQNKALKPERLWALIQRLGGIREQDCLLCGGTSRDGLLCPACVADLPELPQKRCPRCALPTPHGETCGRCLRRPPEHDAALAAYRYDFPLDKLVQSFKYGHRLAWGQYFGGVLGQLVEGLAVDVIVPLPLHLGRLRERGFNQAMELARPIAKQHGWRIDPTLCQRVRPTPPQADLHWRQRVKNIRGAFHCTADLTGKRVLLVDDVMTTGASLNECARTLKLHGAAHVTALAVARALPR